MGYRIQGAWCRVQVQGELVMLKVCVKWKESMIRVRGGGLISTHTCMQGRGVRHAV